MILSTEPDAGSVALLAAYHILYNAILRTYGVVKNLWSMELGLKTGLPEYLTHDMPSEDVARPTPPSWKVVKPAPRYHIVKRVPSQNTDPKPT
jgi:hypothetical protein